MATQGWLPFALLIRGTCLQIPPVNTLWVRMQWSDTRVEIESLLFNLVSRIISMGLLHVRFLVVNQYTAFPEMKLCIPFHSRILGLNNGHQVSLPVP